MKVNKKTIERIAVNTPAELKDSQSHYMYEIIGYYQPSGANWSYKVGYIEYNNQPLLVVENFGSIVVREK